MGGAQVDQPRFFAAGDHFDREAQQRLGLGDEVGGVLGHAQGVGAHGAHLRRGEAAQAFAKAGQAGQRLVLGFLVQVFVRGQAGAQAHGLFHHVQRV